MSSKDSRKDAPEKGSAWQADDGLAARLDRLERRFAAHCRCNDAEHEGLKARVQERIWIHELAAHQAKKTKGGDA